MAQHKLLVDVFGISTLQLVFGWSLGGIQAYQWAAQYPRMVQRIGVSCDVLRC